MIGEYGGTVEKFIGDAVMAVFGLPVAHGDDAERAIGAALDLRDKVRADPRLGSACRSAWASRVAKSWPGATPARARIS